METGRITNAREHLRKINKCGIQQRGRICIYTQKTHQNKLATVGMKRSIQENAKFAYKTIAAQRRIP